MSYHFKPGDSAVQDGLRRIARSQLEAAIEEIRDPDLGRSKAVHQVRKRCKKLRGLARLVRPAFPAYRSANSTLRDAARTLSGVRDADAMLETFDKLAERHGDAFDRERFAPVRERLVEKRSVAAKEGELVDARLALVRETLEEVRGRVGTWRLEADGRDALEGGYAKTFKRARKALKKARKDPTAERMHELRKRVKYHWYHTRLLRAVWPAVMEAREVELDRLGEMLGDEHDLSVLQGEIDRFAGRGLHGTVAADLRSIAEKRRGELQAVILPLAARAFAGDADDEAARIGDLWDGWRAEPGLADPAEEVADKRRQWILLDSDREIERKFIVTGDDWRPAASDAHHIRQGYLVNDDRMNLRVRIVDDRKATVTIKSAAPELDREEIEFTVPVTKARRLIELVEGPIIDKTRHLVPVGETIFEVDEFAEPQPGLVIAEVELATADQDVPKADWLGPEVTGVEGFYGASLARSPDAV